MSPADIPAGPSQVLTPRVSRWLGPWWLCGDSHGLRAPSPDQGPPTHTFKQSQEEETGHMWPAFCESRKCPWKFLPTSRARHADARGGFPLQATGTPEKVGAYEAWVVLGSGALHHWRCVRGRVWAAQGWDGGPVGSPSLKPDLLTTNPSTPCWPPAPNVGGIGHSQAASPPSPP